MNACVRLCEMLKVAAVNTRLSEKKRIEEDGGRVRGERKGEGGIGREGRTKRE